MSFIFVTDSQLNSYGRLLRPPIRMDLYRYVISGNQEEVLRKKYSYVTEYPKTGIIRETPGQIIQVSNLKLTMISDEILYTSGTQILVATENYEDFVNSNPGYLDGFGSIQIQCQPGLYIWVRDSLEDIFLQDYMSE